MFDIQEGVAIGIFIKHKESEQKYANIYHSHLWGARNDKYQTLLDTDITSTRWAAILPQSPFYLFMPQNTDLLGEYEQGWKVTDIMPTNSSGIATHRDHFAVAYDLTTLHKRISDFRNLTISDTEIVEKYELSDTSYWKLRTKRRSLAANAQWEKNLIQCLFRPFDIRACFYHEDIIDRPRSEIINHFLEKDNIGLITTRQVTNSVFCHVSCTRLPIEKKMCSHDRNTNLFPLYIYTDVSQATLFNTHPQSDENRHPNFAANFIAMLSDLLHLEFISSGKGDLQKTFGPEDIFSYIYAILHSPTYRSRYAEFLKMDFPRLPLTSHANLFRTLCSLGSQLVTLHLMEKKLNKMSNFNIQGSGTVETVRYTEPGQSADQGCVWVNREQYFDGVPLEVWNFHIGGYQVCHKWLKDRKGRTLEYDDINHYQQIVAVLAETIRLMAEIDETIIEYGGWPIT